MENSETTPGRRVLRRYSDADRKKLIDKFKATGGTKKAFSEAHGIHPTTFSGWLKRKRERLSGFVEVEVPRGAPAPIEVGLPNGSLIRVHTSGDLNRTAQLIRLVTGAESSSC